MASWCCRMLQVQLEDPPAPSFRCTAFNPGVPLPSGRQQLLRSRPAVEHWPAMGGSYTRQQVRAFLDSTRKTKHCRRFQAAPLTHSLLTVRLLIPPATTTSLDLRSRL